MARMLRRVLEGVLSDEQSRQVWSAFDQIGDIIVIRIPEELMPQKKIIGGALLEQIKCARTVFCQSGDIGGCHRTRGLELIAGAGNTQTEYRENGCRYVVDIARAFFSPRLSSERARIAGMVSDGQTIVNLFAGVGTFSIAAAKDTRCTVYSIDINAEATELCRQSLALNRLAGRVIPVTADAAEAAQDLAGMADHTLMLLPERSDEFLDAAICVTRDGGLIHYYSHVSAPSRAEAPERAEQHLRQVCPVPYELIHSRTVRAIGPRYYQTVLDIRISKG